MALFRIESKAIDVVVTFNIPIVSTDSGAVGNEGVVRSEMDFDAFIRSFCITDFGLFVWRADHEPKKMYYQSNNPTAVAWSRATITVALLYSLLLLSNEVTVFFTVTFQFLEIYLYLTPRLSCGFSAFTIGQVHCTASPQIVHIPTCDSTLTDCQKALPRFIHLSETPTDLSGSLHRDCPYVLSKMSDQDVLEYLYGPWPY